jgi:hypothetical protein
VRDEYVHVRVLRRGHGPRPEHSSVRDKRYAHGCAIYFDGLVIYVEAMDGDRVYQVRVLQGRGRRAQARRLVVACSDQIRCALARDAKRLFQEADDHVRRGPDRIEDVAGVNHQVHITLQDGVHSPPVSLLDVHLPLVAARLGMELRVPAVPQMRIRDVGDPYDLIPLFNPALFRPEYTVDSPRPHVRV